MMLLAVDGGGSTTRAAVVDAQARCLGYGVAAGGNPTAVGADDALSAIGAAAGTALARAGTTGASVTRVVVALAGEPVRLSDRATRSAVGVPEDSPLDRVGDILAMYHSAAVEPDGVVLVAGTGAIAARISQLEVQRVVDGVGWLLGDRGSGFWIGRKVARAVAADLDGSGPATELTDLVLEGLDVSGAREGGGSRPPALDAFMRHVYDDRPVQLARLAPYAFAAAAASDETATAVVSGCEAELARMLRIAREGREHLPVVLGGSVVTRGLKRSGRLTGALAEELSGADVRWAHEGVAGAAVVGLLSEHVEVDAAMLARIREGVAGVAP